MGKTKKACIVLPTYNEQATIKTVLEQIFTQKFPNWSLSVLVVDDTSPDGTADIVTDLQKVYTNLFLLSGKKEGLSIAYKRGFRYVLEHMPDMDYLFEMDADLSHNPAYLRDFLKAADQGYDFIIGSRYIPGGSIPREWKWYRYVLSFWGNQYIRFVGGMARVHDCTSGFRCIGTALLRKMNLDQVLSKGYAFQMSLVHQATRKGARIKEVPIIFTDRVHGSSKLSGWFDTLECLFTATSLRFKRYK